MDTDYALRLQSYTYYIVGFKFEFYSKSGAFSLSEVLHKG